MSPTKKLSAAERFRESRRAEELDGTPAAKRIESDQAALARHHIDRADRTIRHAEDVWEVDPHSISTARGNYRTTATMEEDAALTESIRTHGMQSPLLVRSVEIDGKPGLELVAGWRRLRAAKAASLTRVPVHLLGTITDAQADAFQVMENEQRTQPHVLDTAKRFLEMHQRYGWEQEDIVREMGRSKGTVSILFRAAKLVDKLSEEEQAKLRTEQVSFRTISKILSEDGTDAAKVARFRELAAASAVTVAAKGREPSATPVAPRTRGKRVSRPAAAFAKLATKGGKACKYELRWALDRVQKAPKEALAESVGSLRALAADLAMRYEESQVRETLDGEAATQFDGDLELLRRIAAG